MRTSSINSKDIVAQSNRFEGKYWLNDFSYYSNRVAKSPNGVIALNDIAEVFNPPVFKRQFCKNTPRAVQYFQSSDVQMAEERSSTYVFKGQAESLNLLVNQGDILVTGFGTIGNTRLVSKYQDGTCYANNVCRIRVFEGQKNGFIYAFISSRYGYSQLNKNASGSVVRYIEAPGIKRTIIPNFPESFQTEIDDLIQESARLREEATEALEEAHRIIEKHVTIPESNKSNRASIKDVTSSHNTRLEGFYYTSENRYIYDYITSHYGCKSLKEYTQKIFRPGIFKREYVQNGVMFLGGADIMMSTPKSEKHLSFRQVERMPELKVEKGWMLVTCGGTIGNTVYIDNQLAKCAISQHVMRIVPKEDTPSGFLYAFLSSKIGYKLITMFTYGAVIPSIEPHHLELVPIPTLEKDVVSEIDKLIEGYATKTELAKEKEALAISKVEQEIERWNHQ